MTAGRTRVERMWESARCAIGALAILMLLASCGAPRLAAPATPEAGNQAPESGSPANAQPPDVVADLPCGTGSLRVGDLPAMDRDWREGLAEAEQKARAWQPDAVLSSLRVACQLFEPAFRWQATYYSADAQAFFASDTGEVTPSGVEQWKVPLLPAEELSFGVLHRALIKSGFNDDTMISPSTGVDVRVSTDALPFGPPSAPRDAILYHVAIERRGEERDYFVDGRDGLIHMYS